MKIGILTFHNADNCGAVLQAYALLEYLNLISGCKAEIINYYCSKIEDIYIPSNSIKSKNPVKFIVKSLFYNSIKKTHNCFKLFRKEHLRVSSKRYVPSNRIEIVDDYDIIISGSDQVFNLNLTGGDKTYFCDFINDKENKYTYAASVGEHPVEKSDIDNLIFLLNSFGSISFREKVSVDFVNNICPEIKCHTNIDPVFLLKAFDWEKIASNGFDKPYVMYFPVGKPSKLKNVFNTIKEIAKKNSLVPIITSVAPHKPWIGFKYFGCYSPSEFIGYIKNSDCVVTTSFHGTAFAIIMHKNFFVEVNIKKNERILDLLEITGLSHRAMRDGIVTCDYEISEEEWAYADAQIEKERQRAKDYLISIVKSKEDTNE